MVAPQYAYRGYCERVIDADTLLLRVDCGFHVATTISARLRDIDAPERGTTDGTAATEYVRALLRPANLRWDTEDRREPTPLIVESYRDRQSFARWVCDVWLAGTGELLAGVLVNAGHAVGTRA